MCLLITCEMAGETVPAWLLSPSIPEQAKGTGSVPTGSCGKGSKLLVTTELQRKLASSADRPARYAAQRLATILEADLILNESPGELIDVTRPLHHRQLFSKHTRGWPQELREQLIELVYHPYRQRVRSAIEQLLSAYGFAIHLSLRSFNLRSRGKIRRTDVGLLYDPRRPDEMDFCLDWVDAMWQWAPMLKVRRNYPRRGTGEGWIQSLRTEFADRDYLGIEVWLNRAWARREVALRDEAIGGISDSLQAILEADEDEESQTQAA